MDVFVDDIKDHCSNYVTTAVMSTLEIPASIYKCVIIRQRWVVCCDSKLCIYIPHTQIKLCLVRDVHFHKTSVPHKKKLISCSQVSKVICDYRQFVVIVPAFLLGTFAIKTVCFRAFSDAQGCNALRSQFIHLRL